MDDKVTLLKKKVLFEDLAYILLVFLMLFYNLLAHLSLPSFIVWLWVS